MTRAGRILLSITGFFLLGAGAVRLHADEEAPVIQTTVETHRVETRTADRERGERRIAVFALG